jgi:hypothetical protein
MASIVWIVMVDHGHPRGDVSWKVDKVFESEADARAYAATEIGSEVESYEVVPHAATASRIDPDSTAP